MLTLLLQALPKATICTKGDLQTLFISTDFFFVEGFDAIKRIIRKFFHFLRAGPNHFKIRIRKVSIYPVCRYEIVSDPGNGRTEDRGGPSGAEWRSIVRNR